MTRLFLAAGVAALAISVPAAAKPGEHGGGGGAAASVQRGGGGGGAQQARAVNVQRGGGGGGGAARAFNVQRGSGGGGFAAQRFAAPRVQAMPRMERAQRFAAAPQMRQNAVRQNVGRMGGAQQRAERQQIRTNRLQAAQTRVAQHQQVRANRLQAVQNRVAERQQVRANHLQAAQNRVAQRQQMQANRIAQVQNNMAQRQQMQANRMQRIQQANNAFPGRYGNMNANAVGYGVGGCPPGLANKGCMPPGQAAKLGLTSSVITAANAPLLRNAWQGARVDELNARYGTQILAPNLATSLIGLPVANAPSILGMGLSPLPQPISYLYPSTPNYYYQYAPGYVYQVDQGSNLINALIPLLAGGYMPGSYLPAPMMASYVPDYYGLNSFYPASYGYGGYDSAYGYGGYGYSDPYGYSNTCNRYEYGVVYQVDCMTGMVENVVPVYNNGYGVGQMLPSAYNYYNVPNQYRSVYYDTPNSNYWYAPGAIYQYDPNSSLITSVAALLGPGMTIGQPLPMGYDAYNVPYAYRSTYYDTPNAWYRYSNGYIYQVDPTTQLVSAIVASILT